MPRKEVFQGMSRGKVERIYVSAVDSSENYLRHGIEFSLCDTIEIYPPPPTKKDERLEHSSHFLLYFHSIL